MNAKIDDAPTLSPYLDDEETGGGEISPETEAATEPAWSDEARAFAKDTLETARDACRWVRDTVDEAKAAIDLEGRIGALGPNDSLKVRVSAGAHAGVGMSMEESLDVKRLNDGRYVVSGNAELGVTFGEKLQVSTQALQSVGIEQAAAGRVELTCETAEEAADVTRALRNAQLRQLNVPIGDRQQEILLLASKLSAVEFTGRQSAALDVKGEAFGAALELKAGVRAENTARLEFSPKGDALVLKTSVLVDGAAPKKLKDLLPRTSAELPPSTVLSLGAPLRGKVRVDNETRVPLKGDVAASLAAATAKVTLSAESRASAVVMATGREAKVSFEVSAKQAKDVLEGLALADAAQLASVLDIQASLEVRPFQEKGGEASLGLSSGAVGGSVGLEARLRDVQPERGVKVSGSLGQLLGWLVRD